MRGVQGAALRRQRSRLEAQQRRGTSLSLEGATEQLRRPSTQSLAQPSGLIWGITLFHIGLVFLVIGFLMVITAMIPGYMAKAEAYDLVGTGTFFVVLGGVLTLINRVITRREEDSLGKYVTGRLARSRSGGRLVRDPESMLTPAAPRRAPPAPAGGSPLPPVHTRRPSAVVVNDVHVHVPDGQAKDANGARAPAAGKDGTRKAEAPTV